MAEGWIKLHKKMLDWEWFQDANTFRVWMFLLLRANFREQPFQGIMIPAGGVVTSRAKIAASLGITVNQVDTALKHLKRTGEIRTKKMPSSLHIYIQNWEEYQGENRHEAGNTSETLPNQNRIKPERYKKDKNNKKGKEEKKEYTPALSSEEDKEWEASFGYEPGD